MVHKMEKQAGGLFPVSLASVMHKDKAYSIPQSVSPWALVTRLDILEAEKVAPPKTWDEFVEISKKLQKPPKLTGFGPCLGLYSDTDNNVMNMIWCYGGKLVEADNKTVALHSKGTVAAVQLLADMFNKHKIIPKGAISWDNTGNNKAYQSRQVIFVLNPSSIFAHLADSDKDLYNTTGMLPIPAGPAGAIEELSTAEWVLFKHNPYAEVAKGLAEYWMAGELAGDDRGRGWALGAALQRHVRFRLLETTSVSALAGHPRSWTPVPRSWQVEYGRWRGGR
jgi:multiple sugar transport system substrate-binding protein